MVAKINPDSTIDRLREISQWVSSVLDPDQVLELIIDTATRMMQARASSLLLLDPRTRKLYFKVVTGERKEEVRKYELDVGQGIAGVVAEKGEPLLIQDVRKDPRWFKQISDSIGFQTRSIACVPMKAGNEIIGVVEIIDKEDGSPIQNEDMKLLTVFAELASLAITNARKIHQVQEENKDLKEEIWKKYQIIGESEALQKVVSDGFKVANSKTSTLILGESGTGKELLARLIHLAGPRKDKPMIILNCAALPETLLEAELFGYEKGSFTGAMAKKIGKFELADEGTLFLDEIGEMTQGMQAKLLGVLQEGVFLQGRRECPYFCGCENHFSNKPRYRNRGEGGKIQGRPLLQAQCGSGSYARPEREKRRHRAAGGILSGHLQARKGVQPSDHIGGSDAEDARVSMAR